MGVQTESEVGDIGAVPVCTKCGSERVTRDAWACWNPETGLWELERVHDQEYCQQCECATTFRWTRPVEPGRGAIRDQNDLFRREGQGDGMLVVTQGVKARGDAFMYAAIGAVRTFDAFTPDNDPWGEHDFGAVEIEGEKLFWKIDCYNKSLTAGSENPASDAVTRRVLTIMLADEY